MDKLAINWQNFAQAGLQLKFTFRIRLSGWKSFLFISIMSYFTSL